MSVVASYVGMIMSAGPVAEARDSSRRSKSNDWIAATILQAKVALFVFEELKVLRSKATKDAEIKEIWDLHGDWLKAYESLPAAVARLSDEGYALRPQLEAAFRDVNRTLSIPLDAVSRAERERSEGKTRSFAEVRNVLARRTVHPDC